MDHVVPASDASASSYRLVGSFVIMAMSLPTLAATNKIGYDTLDGESSPIVI